MLTNALAMAMAGATLFGAGCGEEVSHRALGARTSSSAAAHAGDDTGSGGVSGRRLRSLPSALRFESTTLEGRPFTGSDLVERPVVFWFWAPWCPKCVAEGPHVAEVARKYANRVDFVGVGGHGNKGEMRRFVTRTGTGNGAITQLDDRSGQLFSRFKVNEVPTFVFLTLDGKATRDSGRLGIGQLEQRVRRISGG